MFRKTHRETTVLEPLLTKVTGLHPATLYTKKHHHWCFPANFAKFLSNLLQKQLFAGILQNRSS